MTISFSKIPASFDVCKAWADNGLISDCGTVLFTSTPADFARLFPTSCPIERLRMALKQFALNPNWETCAFHFGRVRRTNGRGQAAQDRLFGEGGVLENLEGGWSFSGNFHALSLGFNFMTNDRALAEEFLNLMADNYSSSMYRSAASEVYRNDSDELCDVYFNAARGSMCVVSAEDKPFLADLESAPARRAYLKAMFEGAELIGSRDSVDVGSVLRDNIETLLK